MAASMWGWTKLAQAALRRLTGVFIVAGLRADLAGTFFAGVFAAAPLVVAAAPLLFRRLRYNSSVRSMIFAPGLVRCCRSAGSVSTTRPTEMIDSWGKVHPCRLENQFVTAA